MKVIPYSKIVSVVLFLLTMAILCLSMFQEITEFTNDPELGGGIEKLDKPILTMKDWFDGKYQEDLAKYKNQNFGFRSTLIRVHNQIEYDCFNEFNANGVLIGKDFYFYEEAYINSYFGLDFVGDSTVRENTRKLKMVQDTLSKLKIETLFIIAPGKGTYLPEYFPSKYDSFVKGKTNYDAYVKAFDKSEIKYIDYNKWFLQLKDTTSYPLYGKGGIHWSSYGEILVCDSLIRYLNNKTSCKVPNIVVGDIELSATNQKRDYDIGEGLNLVFQLNTFPMAYPNFYFEKSDENTRCRLISVADSYYWGLYNIGFSEQLFKEGKFWYYNAMVYPESAKESLKTESLNIQKEVEKKDLVLIVSTEMNLRIFTFGFIDQLYAKYYH